MPVNPDPCSGMINLIHVIIRIKETKRKLETGDKVRVRITAVSLGRSGGSGKIGVTARQPFLGKLEWIQQEVGKLEGTLEEAPADAKAKAAGE